MRPSKSGPSAGPAGDTELAPSCRSTVRWIRRWPRIDSSTRSSHCVSRSGSLIRRSVPPQRQAEARGLVAGDAVGQARGSVIQRAFARAAHQVVLDAAAGYRSRPCGRRRAGPAWRPPGGAPSPRSAPPSPGARGGQRPPSRGHVAIRSRSRAFIGFSQARAVALPRLIFTILMIMSNVPSVYPYLASPSAGILLAAGRGSRRRAPGHRKLLAPLPQGPCVAVASARRLRAAVDSVVAVVRPGNAALAALLRTEDCRVIEADPAGEGMGTSLATAARHLLALPTRRARCWWRWRTCPGFVTPAWRACWMRCNMRRWRRRRIGDGAAIPWIPRGPAASAGAVERGRGARRLLGQPGLRLVEVDDPGVLLDIDTPADLDRAG